MFNSKDSILWSFLKIVAALLSIFIVGPFKAAKWLNDRVYAQWRLNGVWQLFWGFLSSMASAVGAYLLLLHGGTLGFPLFGVEDWLAIPHPHLATVGSAGVFACVAIYAYPLTWLVLLQWFWKVWQAYYRRVAEFLSKSHFPDGVYETNGYRLARELTEFLRVLPGSQRLWTTLVKERSDSAVVVIESTIVYAGIAWTAWLASHAVYAAGQALIAASVLSALVSAFAAYIALIVFGMVAYPLVKVIRTGKAYALGVVAGLAAGYATCTFVVPALAQSFWSDWALPAASVWLTVAYVYPAVTLVLSTGFIKRVFDKVVKPLLTSVYQGKNSDFGRLVQQLLNLAGTAAVAALAWWFAGVAHLPQWLAFTWLALIPLAAFATYSLLGKLLDWNGGNYLIGAVVSLASAVATVSVIGYRDWVHVVAVSIPAAVAVLLLVFFIVYPLLYWVVRFVFTLPGIGLLTGAAGAWLHSLHASVWTGFQRLSDLCERVYSSAYGTEGDFRRLANHVADILAAASLAAIAYYAATALWYGYGTVASGVLAFAVFMLSYLLGNKFVFRQKVEPASTIASALLAIAFGASIQGASVFGLWFAVPFASAFAGFLYFLAIPLFYIGVRQVSDPWLTALLLPLFDGLYALVSQQFGFIITGLERIYRFFKPFFAGVVRVLALGWMFLTEAWSSLFGGRRS